MLRVAIIDSEEEYLRQLCAYVIERKQSNLILETFQDRQDFIANEKREEYDAIVLSVSYFEEMDTFKQENRIILLCEETVPREAEGIPVILKYQSAGSLIAQILELSQQDNRKEDQWIQAIRGEVIGIYSPVHHEAQMMFSMTLAQMLGENQKVLYLNFMESSGFSKIYHIEGKRGLSEVLYEAMVTEGRISHAILSAAIPLCNVDCILPVRNPEHLMEVSEAAYEKLFYEISVSSGYQIIVVDFGGMFPGFYKVLGQCSSVYCIGREGLVDNCRMQEFEEYLKKKSYNDKKISKLVLPKEQEGFLGEDMIQRGIYGTIGDYVRKTILGGTEFG